MSGKNDRRRRDRRRTGRRQSERPWWRNRRGAIILGGLALAGVVLLSLENRQWDPTSVPSVDPDTLSPTVHYEEGTAERLDRARVDSIRHALAGAGFEELIAAGVTASGVVTEAPLVCDSVRRIRLLDDEEPYPTLVAMADSGRVPAAECRWVSPGETQPAPFLLLIPAGLVSAFDSIPETAVGFVPRRRLRAEIEWIGTRRAIALRAGGILRAIEDWAD